MKLNLGITMVTAALANLSLSGTSPAQSANPPTPTTRILAIGTVNPGADPAAVRSIAFILNVTDPAAARHTLEKLPLG